MEFGNINFLNKTYVYLICSRTVSNSFFFFVTDPSPIELITKFYDVISETLKIRPEVETGEIINIEPNGEKSRYPAKNIALKILSLKIAAFLKWNLGT